MISYSRVKENIIDAGFRILKVLQFGAKTADVVSSFGDDSAPLPEMVAIYANTSEQGDRIIIGYLNKNQISEPGEKRIFSLNSDGSLSFAIHLKGDGTCEIGGADDYAIRYNKLNEALQQQVLSINSELASAAAGISSAGGVYIPQPITLDLSQSKIDEIKVL